MRNWADVETTHPEFAAAVRARFAAAKHHVLATLTRDGSPRVSGTEVEFWRSDLIVGTGPQAVKTLDLRRDPRYALHAHTGDGSMAGGDAKVSGRAVELDDPEVLAAFAAYTGQPPMPFTLFRLEPTAVVLTDIDGDRLRIRTLREDLQTVYR